MLLAKKPAKVETYNDLDSSLVNFFRVLRDAKKFEKLVHMLTYTPYSRELYEENLEALTSENPGADFEGREIEWACAFYVGSRMALSGVIGNDWGYAIKDISQPDAFARSVDILKRFAARLKHVQVEHRDARHVIRTHDGRNLLMYCDPPYPNDSRRAGEYTCEMSNEDHEELLDILLASPAMILLSSYPSEMYMDKLGSAGWTRETKDITCSAAARVKGSGLQGAGAVTEKQMRTEVLWRNPASVAALQGTSGAQRGLWDEFSTR